MFQPKGTGSVMKKMEIENITNIILTTDQNTLQFNVGTNYISTVNDNVIQIGHDGKPILKITLDAQDILKLMTWLVGQEKHIQEKHQSKTQNYTQLADKIANILEYRKKPDSEDRQIIRSIERVLESSEN